MSVLIKGMKMPTSCKNCELAKHFDGYNENDCPFNAFSFYDCPLVELPEHGDLIEREYAIASACSGRIRALPTTEDGEDWIRVEEVRQSIKSVPVVIPAERSEE